MKLSPKIIGTFTLGSLMGLLLGAVLWRASDVALKTQRETAVLRGEGAPKNTKPNGIALKHPVDGQSPPSATEGIAQAKEAFLSLGKIGSSNWSSITGGPAFTKAMMGLSGFTSSDYAALFVELSAGGLGDDAMAPPLMAWATVDAQAALDFASADKKLQTKENVLAMIVLQLARTDLASARSAVAKMEKDEQSRCQIAMVVALFETDRPAAARLANEFGDKKTSAKLYQNWAEEDLPAAMASFGAGHPGLEEIAAWAASLTGEVQAQAVGDVAKAWTGKNSADASVWIKSLPNGNARDAAVTHLINAIRNEFPADALQWAQSISNPEQQAKALQSIKTTTPN